MGSQAGSWRAEGGADRYRITRHKEGSHQHKKLKGRESFWHKKEGVRYLRYLHLPGENVLKGLGTMRPAAKFLSEKCAESTLRAFFALSLTNHAGGPATWPWGTGWEAMCRFGIHWHRSWIQWRPKIMKHLLKKNYIEGIDAELNAFIKGN